jgi:hypothetical protein
MNVGCFVQVRRCLLCALCSETLTSNMSMTLRRSGTAMMMRASTMGKLYSLTGKMLRLWALPIQCCRRNNA